MIKARFTKVIFAIAILVLPALPVLAIDPITEPYSTQDPEGLRAPNDPIIDNHFQIEDPSLGPSGPSSYGLGPI